MISVSPCSNCKHKREKIGFQMACDAFPDGMPYDFNDDIVEEIKECNNGIGYEESDEQ